jgi:hypothetical protein
MLEILLRVLPLRGVEFKSGMFDEEINLYVYEPNSKVVVTNVRGERITRNVNSSGFLDVDHKSVKEQEIYRIGFFGDSYVEALQVLLNDTFYRRIGEKLSDKQVEILGFGNSGWGTTHSFLVSKKFSEYYNIDLVVYTFSENDLGDQIYKLKKVESLPYPFITTNGKIKIDNSMIKNYVDKRKKYETLEYFYRKSFLLQNIYRRFKMLLKYGIKTSVDIEDIEMSSISSKDNYPNSNDLPSGWPLDIKNDAMLLGEKTILKWKNEVNLLDKEFTIMYVPREGEWKKPDKIQDSWKNWLKKFCKLENIDFIDPTLFFLQYDNIGKKIYDDHLSVEGHKAISESFMDWFINKPK